jgi:hypothetical protein
MDADNNKTKKLAIGITHLMEKEDCSFLELILAFAKVIASMCYEEKTSPEEVMTDLKEWAITMHKGLAAKYATKPKLEVVGGGIMSLTESLASYPEIVLADKMKQLCKDAPTEVITLAIGTVLHDKLEHETDFAALLVLSELTDFIHSARVPDKNDE